MTRPTSNQASQDRRRHLKKRPDRSKHHVEGAGGFDLLSNEEPSPALRQISEGERRGLIEQLADAFDQLGAVLE